MDHDMFDVAWHGPGGERRHLPAATQPRMSLGGAGRQSVSEAHHPESRRGAAQKRAAMEGSIVDWSVVCVHGVLLL